jgi:hypothetical protein
LYCQLWTGAGAYRKIGQNKYSYRMLISTAMRQTSNAMRRTAQTKHANELHCSSHFVDTDAVWDQVRRDNGVVVVVVGVVVVGGGVGVVGVGVVVCCVLVVVVVVV